MGEAFHLLADRIHDAGMAMAGVDDRDAAAEIDVALALHVPDLGIQRAGRRDGRGVADAADDGGLPASKEISIGGHGGAPDLSARRHLRRKCARLNKCLDCAALVSF